MSPSEMHSVSLMMEAVQQALEPIRKSLQTDGFDLTVESIEQGVASLVVFSWARRMYRVLNPPRAY